MADWTHLALVLHGGDGALGGPVDGVGGDGLVEEGVVEVAFPTESRILAELADVFRLELKGNMS